MNLRHYLELLHRSLLELAQAFGEVAEAHRDEPDVRIDCEKFAKQSTHRRDLLRPFLAEYQASDAGNGSLTVTAAAISLSEGFVGHDSGPLHVAGALGVPVIGVFAPGEPKRTFPQGVGPWRMIHRATPNEIGAADLLHEITDLGLFSAP